MFKPSTTCPECGITSVQNCNHQPATLRDQFAMAALTGIWSNEWQVKLTTEFAKDTGQDPIKVLAEQAYEQADAALLARKEEQK